MTYKIQKYNFSGLRTQPLFMDYDV